MELLISCPLCSQPGFSDVNSLWLNLIRAATSQLNCPVCEEVLCGLDKLTIHLMSHSLRDQISSTCVPSNASFSSATSLRGLDSHIPHESAMVSPPVHQQPMKENSSIASYVVINFPPIQSVSMETSSQFLPSEFPNATQNEEPINVSSSLKPEHSVLSAVKAEASNNFPARTMISQPPNLASTLPGNEDSDTPSSFKVRDGCTIGEKLHSKESKQRVHKELKNHETSLSKAFSESESNEKFTCRTLKSGPTIRCQMCGLTLKDNNIALLHYQLVHNCSPYNDSEYQLPPTKNDEKETSFKQFPSRCKRESMASQSRDAANPLHRFPCHICNKVFRMRGSLMVHLRVAHTPSGTAGLTSRLENSCHSLTPKTKDDVSCKLSLQNLSLRDTNTTAAIGKELDIFGDVVGKINDQTQLGKNNCMVILEPSCSPVDDQTCSVVHQSGKKAIKPCSNKKSSSSAVNVPSPINSSLVVSATPMESLGVIFPCAHCNKTFAKEVLLTQHIKSHESKQWECDVCLKSFTTKYFLKKHKRLHTGEMPYTCGICSKSFTFQQSYHKHLLYHSDEKPHSCAECGRAFKELSTLHNHQRIHTGEKPWACETCDIAPVCA